MEYLQYLMQSSFYVIVAIYSSFKPYYKWNTFNTLQTKIEWYSQYSFKPYYKWNTFNTATGNDVSWTEIVLNLIINGIPSILSV